MFILGFPLLLITFAIYNMIAFLTPGVAWTAPVTTVHMLSLIHISEPTRP